MNDAAQPHGFDDEDPFRQRPALSRALDFAPFEETIFEEDVAHYLAESADAASFATTPERGSSTGAFSPLLVAAIPGIALLIIGWSIASSTLQIVGVALVALAVIAGVLLQRKRAAQVDDLADYRFRLHNFAAANRLEFFAMRPDPERRGSLFTLGDADRRTQHVIRWPGRELEVGEYHFSTQNPRGKSVAAWWWYARIEVVGRLPELQLRTNANSGFFGLGRLQSPDDGSRQLEQVVLRTEGGEKYTLFADQLNIQAAQELSDSRLLDLLTRLYVDLEIIDGEALLYSQQPLGALDPSEWIALIEVALLLRKRSALT